MTRISLPPIVAPAFAQDGVRPVNLRTDLRPLADLIELVFADSIDSSGRSAIREMRYLSNLGYGLKLIARLNELALGISLGFVYVLDGRLVGNVSVYPASYPSALGETWILANVGVHPDCQRRGIANDLLRASLEMIRRRGAARVILQVNYENEPALRLYEGLGFEYERAWLVWRRSGFLRSPLSMTRAMDVDRWRPSDWAAGIRTGARRPPQPPRRAWLAEAPAPGGIQAIPLAPAAQPGRAQQRRKDGRTGYRDRLDPGVLLGGKRAGLRQCSRLALRRSGDRTSAFCAGAAGQAGCALRPVNDCD